MTVDIIGRGNVASHLFKALSRHTDVCLVNPHTFEYLRADTDFVLISVSDNAIADVVQRLYGSSAIVAHTSGSTPVSTLDSLERYGVFYPLQTFSKDVELNYAEIPFFIEGNSPEVTQKLTDLAHLVSSKVYPADSETRKTLHLASVFACNFTNALAGVAYSLLTDTGLDFKVLLPLMKQTVAKLENLTPREAQTGPAARGDSKIIHAHIEMLKNYPQLAEIYSQITNLISSK